MEEKTKEKNELHNMLITISFELGCNKQKANNLTNWELLDLILKDIHIRRITMERDKKDLRVMNRDLNRLKQKTLPFIDHIKSYE